MRKKKERTGEKAAGSYFLKGASGAQADGSGTGRKIPKEKSKNTHKEIKEY